MARKTNYHKFVTEDKLSKINPINLTLIKDYLEYLKSIDRSAGTISTYESDLNIFMIWYMENCDNKLFTDIKKRDVIKYQNYLLNDLGLSPARIRRLRATISSLSNYILNILDDEYPVFQNIINKIPAPQKQDIREKTILSEEQVEYLLNYLIKNNKYQQACFVACLAGSGARKAEMPRFKMSFFDEENYMYGLYKTPKITTKGRGSKGKLLNKYVIKAVVRHYLDLWIEERQKLGVDIDDLFVFKKDNKWESIKISTIDSWCEQFSKILNVDFYCHAVRHYYATGLSKAGVPLNKIRDLMGHSESSTSEIYIDIDEEDNLKDIFDENGLKPQKKQISDEEEKKKGNSFSR